MITAFCRRIVLIIFCSRLPFYTYAHNTTDQSSDESSGKSGITTTPRAPIDVSHLGYYDGDWEHFCDRKNINEEFSYFPGHELKQLRILLCNVWEEKRFDNQAFASSAVYKYCAVMRHRVDRFLEQFIQKFSLDDEVKKQELISGIGQVNENTTCCKVCVTEFEKKCIAPENPYTFMFKPIFARACTYDGLTTENILPTIEEVCHGQFMTDKIDFKPYLISIGYRKS